MHLSCYAGPLCWQWVTNPTAGEFTVGLIQPAREWELRAACGVGAGSPRRAAARWKGTLLVLSCGEVWGSAGAMPAPWCPASVVPRLVQGRRSGQGGGSAGGTWGRSQPADWDLHRASGGVAALQEPAWLGWRVVRGPVLRGSLVLQWVLL